MRSIHRALVFSLVLGAFAAAAACGQTSPSQSILVDGAIVADVSGDQRYLAYYVQPTRLANGPYSGSLEVKPLLGGSTISLGADAYDANFNGSDEVLYFFQHPETDPTTQLYTGTLSVWTPKLTAPVAVSSGYVPISGTLPDHSVTVFFDTPQPNQSSVGDVKLLRTGDCVGTTCPVETLATGVVVNAIRMAFDGRYAAYDVQSSSSGIVGRDVFLVSIADGTTTLVASTTTPSEVVSAQRFSDLAPDESLLATMTTTNGNPLQLEVISTATGAAVGWGALPAGSLCTGVRFADSATLIVSALDADGNASLYVTTATSASLLVNATQFFLLPVPEGSARYVFFSTTPQTALAAGASFDLNLLDLAYPMAPPVPLATSTRILPSLSQDRSTLWLLDQYDASTGVGALVTASLPTGTRSTVSPAVYAGSVNFASGTNRLVYSPVGSLASTVPNGLGWALDVWSDGTSSEVDHDDLRWSSSASPPTIYVSTDNPLRLYAEALP